MCVFSSDLIAVARIVGFYFRSIYWIYWNLFIIFFSLLFVEEDQKCAVKVIGKTISGEQPCDCGQACRYNTYIEDSWERGRERVAEWLRRWTKIKGSLVRFPQPWSCVNALSKLWIHIASVQPSSNGIQMEQGLISCEWLQQQKMQSVLLGKVTVRVSSNAWG